MTKLLINEHPLIVLPTLAVKVGLNEAIILQQVHYWLDSRTNKNIKEGKHWVYNTYSQWQEQFPFLSEATIRRSIANLEKSGLLISKNHNSNSFSKTKWYTINYEKLSELEDSIEAEMSSCSKETARSAQNEQTMIAKRAEDVINMSSSIKETKTTTKTTTNISLEMNDKFFQERELIKVWNEIVEEGKKEISPTADRLKLLSKRFGDFFNNNIEEWANFCKKITTSKFLMGEVTDFRVSLDWAIEPKSIVKILDREYKIGDRLIGADNKIEDVTEEDLLSKIRRADYPLFWKQIQESLLINEGRATYVSWITKLTFTRYEEGVIELSTPSKFIAQYTEQHFTMAIKRIAENLLKDFKSVKISSSKP